MGWRLTPVLLKIVASWERAVEIFTPTRGAISSSDSPRARCCARRIFGRREIERPSEQLFARHRKFDFFQIYHVEAGTVRRLTVRRAFPDLVRGGHGRRSGINELTLDLIHAPLPRKIPPARRLIAPRR